MDIAKNWFMAKCIDKLCNVYQYIEDPNCEKEEAKELLETVINDLIRDMDSK